jgi:acetyl esterase/lipase
MPRIPDGGLRRAAERLVASTPALDWGRRGVLGSLGLGFDHVREAHDIRYGPAPSNALDLYFPAGRQPRHPVLFVHGGSWRSGHRQEYRFVGRSLASRGHAVAVVGYRLFPETRFPGFVQDVAEALVFLHENHARLGWPEAPVFLCGHSAGAHIAALVGMEPAFLAPLAARPPVAGMITLSAPFSFVPERDPSLFEVFGLRHSPQAWLPMCPLQCVGPDRPPLLAVHGDADRVVLYSGAERMVAQCREAGQRADLLTLRGQGHFQPLFAFHPRMPGHSELMDALAIFCGETA